MNSDTKGQEGRWPKSVLVCPECGIVGFGHLTKCRSIPTPKETVEVVPASELGRYREAVAEKDRETDAWMQTVRRTGKWGKEEQARAERYRKALEEISDDEDLGEMELREVAADALDPKHSEEETG